MIDLETTTIYLNFTDAHVTDAHVIEEFSNKW